MTFNSNVKSKMDKKDLVYRKMLRTDIKDLVEANLALRSIQAHVISVCKRPVEKFEILTSAGFKKLFASWDTLAQETFCQKVAGLRHFELKKILLGE